PWGVIRDSRFSSLRSMSKPDTCPNGHPVGMPDKSCPNCQTMLDGDFVPLPAPTLPVIPEYEILAELGRGGMGVVYKARHLALEPTVALKMIRECHFAGAEEVRRFHREAQALAKLNHPNIVRIFDVDVYQGNPFFTLEYIGGGSLAQFLGGKPQP